MYSDERQSTRSPTTSLTDSYGDGPAARANGRGYQLRSTSAEENGRDDNEYEEALGDDDESPRNDRPPQRSEDQYIAALRHRFPSRPKSDYAYSRPPGPAAIPAGPPLPTTTQPPPAPPPPPTTTTPGTTTTPRSGLYQSSLRPTTGGANTSDSSGGRTFPRPNLRPVNPDQQNTYARRVGGDTTTPISPSTPTTPRLNVRINEPNMGTNRLAPSTFNRQADPSRTQESIFEKVPSHGPVSYLGIGTFSQFEHCLHECLERERRMTGVASHITRHDIPGTISAHDYSYDHVSTSPLSHHGLYPATVHSFIDYPSQPTSSFSLDDIRHINVALSRSGIPLFPYCRPYHDSYHSSIPSPHTIISSPYPNRRHVSGEVVSACRVVDEDPAILSNRNGTQAVQNVWNAIQNHRPFSRSISPRGLYDI